MAWWKRHTPQPITIECETIIGDIRKCFAVTVPAGTPWEEIETMLVRCGMIDPPKITGTPTQTVDVYDR